MQVSWMLLKGKRFFYKQEYLYLLMGLKGVYSLETNEALLFISVERVTSCIVSL